VTPAIPQPDNPPEERPLGSWKEIAAFFDVSVRAVQLWEHERGLPVRRNPGGRGRVYAYPSELQAWRQGVLMVADFPQEPPESTPTARRTSRWIYWVAPLLVTAISLLVLWLPRFRQGSPATWRLAGQVLVVADEDGRTLWSHRFEEAPVGWQQNDSRSRPLFQDLDEDGELELLFPEAYRSHEFSPRLMCFSSSGSVRWTYQQDRTVDTRAERFPPPYEFNHYAVLSGAHGNSKRIIVTVAHNTFYPSAAVLLDAANGAVLREYWHSGHFNSMLVTDLVPGGGPEIYLGAVSNSYRQASIIALDPDNFGGASREENLEYQIQGMPPARELCRVLIPRMMAGQILSRFATLDSIVRQGETIIAGVNENALGPEQLFLLLTFGPRLSLVDLSFGSTTYPSYRRLHLQGLIPTGNPDPELPNLRKLRYLTPWPRESAQFAAPPPPTAR